MSARILKFPAADRPIRFDAVRLGFDFNGHCLEHYHLNKLRFRTFFSSRKEARVVARRLIVEHGIASAPKPRRSEVPG